MESTAGETMTPTIPEIEARIRSVTTQPGKSWTANFYAEDIAFLLAEVRRMEDEVRKKDAQLEIAREECWTSDVKKESQ